MWLSCDDWRKPVIPVSLPRQLSGSHCLPSVKTAHLWHDRGAAQTNVRIAVLPLPRTSSRRGCCTALQSCWETISVGSAVAGGVRVVYGRVPEAGEELGDWPAGGIDDHRIGSADNVTSAPGNRLLPLLDEDDLA